MSSLVVSCATPVETSAFGESFAQIVQPGDVVLLSGELGAGKTTFIKGVVRALGGKIPVTSPTFVLCHLYDTEPIVAHVDCWRLSAVDEVIDLALEEVLDDGGVAFIEWGDLAEPVLGRDAVRLCFVVEDSPSDGVAQAANGSPIFERTITVSAEGATWSDRLSQLQAALNSDGARQVS